MVRAPPAPRGELRGVLRPPHARTARRGIGPAGTDGVHRGACLAGEGDPDGAAARQALGCCAGRDRPDLRAGGIVRPGRAARVTGEAQRPAQCSYYSFARVVLAPLSVRPDCPIVGVPSLADLL